MTLYLSRKGVSYSKVEQSERYIAKILIVFFAKLTNKLFVFVHFVRKQKHTSRKSIPARIRAREFCLGVPELLLGLIRRDDCVEATICSKICTSSDQFLHLD